MNRRRLGRTGEQVSEIGLGGVWFADKSRASDHARVIQKAVKLGITMIDTAPGYKDSEEVLGQVLTKLPREKLFITTKYYPYGEGDKLDLDPKDFLRRLAKSLLMLQCGWIDALYLHWVHSADDIETILSSELASALQKFKTTGHIRYIGVSEASEMDGEHKMLAKALPAKFFDMVMVTYNVFLQTAEREVFPLARETDTGVVVMMPLNQPMGKVGLVNRELGNENVRHLVEKGAVPDAPPYNQADVLDFLASDGKRTMPQAAIRYCLDRPEVSCVLTGTSNVKHLEENLRAAEQPPLSAEIHARARELFGMVNIQVK